MANNDLKADKIIMILQGITPCFPESNSDTKEYFCRPLEDGSYNWLSLQPVIVW